MPCGHVLSRLPSTSLQVLRFRDSLMEWHASTAGVNPVVTRSAWRCLIFDLWLSACTHFMAGFGRIRWNSLAEIQRWQEEMSQLTYSHSSDTAAVCPLLSNKGLWSERLSWFKSVRDIWWCWYGSLRYVHVVDNVFVSLSLWMFVCVCITVQECFPICFLCVFDRDERALCSHVCWQEVRHSCTRPQLVSVRILCSFASTHFCSVFFSFFPVPFKVWE